MLGAGLGSAGAVGSGLGGVAKTLGSTGIKALYNLGVQEAKKDYIKVLIKEVKKISRLKADLLHNC